jgi:hypothetical protein
METKEINNFYAVPLIGGILCILAIFTYLELLMHDILQWLLFGIPGIIDLICGILMLSLAFRLRSGITTYINEKKKLIALSWVAIIGSSGLAIFFMIIGGFSYYWGLFLNLITVTGFTGGIVTLLGIVFYRIVNERKFITRPPLVQEKDVYIPRPVEEPKFYPDAKFCTNCGFNLEGGPFRFCPNCGNKLNSE